MGLLEKDSLLPVTANAKMLAQALKARQQPRTQLTGQGLLDTAAIGLSPVPVIGDALGLAADASRYINDPSSRTPLNFGLTALGALPFVPPASAIFGGVLAKTANLDKKAIAEGMEKAGRSRDYIWKETGWFKGPEGKWKFEIDDSGASLVNTPINKSWEQFSRDAELEKYGRDFQPSKLNAKEFKQYKNYRSELAREYDKTNATTRPLDQIFKHDLAAQAYPDVYGKLSARYDPSLGKEGLYSHSTISFGDTSNNDGAIGLFGHELQHSIQALEGFQSGGSPAQFLNKTSDPYEAYRRLAGEAEARAVQSRMNMNQQQRQATPPWQSYDVPWEQLIIK